MSNTVNVNDIPNIYRYVLQSKESGHIHSQIFNTRQEAREFKNENQRIIQLAPIKVVR